MSDALHLDGGKEPRRGKRRTGLRFFLLFSLALICFAGGAVVYHYSLKNSQTWLLVAEDGRVVVKRGIPFPTGEMQYEGGPAYAPIELPAGHTFSAVRLQGHEALDRALFGLLSELSREALQRALEREGDPALERARGYLKRAEGLITLDEQREDELLRLRGDLDMIRGQALLQNVVPELERALVELRQAQARGSSLQPSAEAWVAWIESRLGEFRTALETRRPPAQFASPAPPISLPPVAAPAFAPPTGSLPTPAEAVPQPGGLPPSTAPTAPAAPTAPPTPSLTAPPPAPSSPAAVPHAPAPAATAGPPQAPAAALPRPSAPSPAHPGTPTGAPAAPQPLQPATVTPPSTSP